MMKQKVDIHQNPVKQDYADLPEHWCYSSARDYAGGVGFIAVCRGWWVWYAFPRRALEEITRIRSRAVGMQRVVRSQVWVLAETVGT